MDKNIQFLVYAIIALLIAVMYGFSAIEIIIRKSKDPKENMDGLEFSAGWAIIGIIVTLICGWLAKIEWVVKNLNLSSDLLFIIPGVFIGRWLLYYINNTYASKGILSIEHQINHEYLKVLDAVFVDIKEDNNKPGKSYYTNPDGYVEQIVILNLMQKKITSGKYASQIEHLEVKIFNQVGRIGNKYIKLKGYQQIFDMFDLNDKKVEVLLHLMVKKNKIISKKDKNNNRLLFKPAEYGKIKRLFKGLFK